MAARKAVAEAGTLKVVPSPELPLVVDGIDVSAARDRVEDWEFVEAMADLVGSDEAGSLPAVVRYMRALFGGDYARVKAELRERGGGKLTVEAMNEFAMKVVEAAGAKN